MKTLIKGNNEMQTTIKHNQASKSTELQNAWANSVVTSTAAAPSPTDGFGQKMALCASNGIRVCHDSAIVPRGKLNLEMPPKKDAFIIANGSSVGWFGNG